MESSGVESSRASGPLGRDPAAKHDASPANRRDRRRHLCDGSLLLQEYEVDGSYVRYLYLDDIQSHELNFSSILDLVVILWNVLRNKNLSFHPVVWSTVNPFRTMGSRC